MSREAVRGTVLPSVAGPRIASLDQFRGYTVLGMFFVNFMGRFEAIPAVFKHHNTFCSYADTIMPQFFFAVGMAYRLTLLRRLEKAGPASTCLNVLKRNLGLILLGVMIYSAGSAPPWAQFAEKGMGAVLNKEYLRQVFQTLVHIGVTALWILPVIRSGPAVRVLFACLSGVLHLVLSYLWYFAWVTTDPKGIDGGVLGFLTWSIPMLAGSLAYDVVRARPDRAVGRLAAGGLLMMVLGYGLSCLVLPPKPATPQEEAGRAEAPAGPSLTFRWAEPPFRGPAGTDSEPGKPVSLLRMSQRAGSVSYLTFGAGFSLELYALFVLLCDGGAAMRLGLFRTLGGNALAAYILHEIVNNAMQPFAPHDAPLWYAMALFGVFLGVCYLFVRHLEKAGLFLKL
jgi:predicted acyltransferase